jgi:hypothetical protein
MNMTKESPLYIAVSITKDNVTCATSSDYEEVKRDLVNIHSLGFNTEYDDGYIFEASDKGEAKPIFNVRAFLSGDEHAENR